MNNTNGLISGDNKGYASYLMEKDMNKGALPGHVRTFSFIWHCVSLCTVFVLREISLQHLPRVMKVMYLPTLRVLTVLTLGCLVNSTTVPVTARLV